MNSTSLALQLEKLKVPQTSVHKEKYGSVSFIYEFAQAKTIDIDTHFSNAIHSLNNLIQIDSHFKNYKTTLFHESSKKFDRAIKNKETNEELNFIIEEFLFRISKYFQLTDTHKVLEYMIQKYRINEYNTDALIGSVLPYHETRMFVRLIQTCSAIKNPGNNRFYWMKKFQENGTPLSKSILLNHCLSDMEFTRFVTDSVFKALKFDPDNTVFPSFLTSFSLNLIQRSTKDVLISHILSVVSKCLSLNDPQLYIVSYMIFCCMCNHVKLNIKIVNKLLKSFIRNEVNINEFTLISFEIIIQSQELSFLPKIFINKEFINNLINYSSQYKYEALLKAIILTILYYKNDEDSDIEMYKNYLQVLFEISNSMSENTVKDIVSLINDTDISNELHRYVIQHIAKIFPEWFDLAISSLDSIKNIFSYLNSIRYQIVGNSKVPLYVGINHCNVHIRRRSYKFFAKHFSTLIKNIDSKDLMFAKCIILENLMKNNDFEPTEKLDSLLKILSIKEEIFHILTCEEYENFALNYLIWINKNENHTDLEFNKLKKLLIEIYCSKSFFDYSINNQQQDKNLLEKLFFNKMEQMLIINLISTDFELSSLILNSNYAKSDILFQSIYKNSLLERKNLNNDEQIKWIASNLNGIIYYLHQNINELFSKPDLWNSIKLFANDNRQFSFLFLYSLIKMLKNYEITCYEERGQVVYQFAINLFLHLLTSKISSHSETKVTDVNQYNDINMDEYFLNEFLNFNNQRISLLIAGYIAYCFIEQKSLSDELPSNADWYLTDVTQFINYDFYYKIYHLLIYYSTPNENKPLSSKVYKFFRHLFSIFLNRKIQNNSLGFKFFLPLIVNQNNFIKKQTLIILDNLFKRPTISEIFLNCLRSNYQYLISYLLALTSSNVTIRQLALSNIKSISSNLVHKDDDNNELQSFAQTISQEEAAILIDEKSIAILLGRLQSNSENSLINELFSTIIFILTANNSKVTTINKVSLLRLLKYCNLNTKSIIFEFYSDLLFSTKEEKLISHDEELQIQEIISYYNYKIFDDSQLFNSDQENSCLKFLLKCIEKSGLILTENVSLSIYDLLSSTRFNSIYQVNQRVALKIVYSLLLTQLELSEKQSSIVSYSNLINSIQNQLRKITFNCDLIIQMMHILVPIEDIYDSFSEGPKEKRLKLDKSVRDQSINAWKLFRIYVSLLSNIENLNCTNELIKILFEYLKLTFMEVDDNASELTRQTLLYLIVNCIELTLFKQSSTLKQIKLQQNKQNFTNIEPMIVDESKDEENEINIEDFLNNINVDIVIDCMLESRVKETQRISLLLISLIASHFRRQIVEYLVEIFTFIGSNLLHCDDQYSLAILFETMESIIPIIIETNKNSYESISGSSLDLKQYIISVFIKSFSDIPAYRRLPLFTKLINLLNPEYFLPIITVRLMEQICLLKSEIEKEANFSFLNNLFNEFSYNIQLKSLCTLLYLFEKKFLNDHFRYAIEQKINTNQTRFISAPFRDDCIQFNSLIEMMKSICKDYKFNIIYDEDKLLCGLSILKFVTLVISSQEFITNVRSCDYQIISTPLIYLINIVLELNVLLSSGGGSKSKVNVYRTRFKLTLDNILLKYNLLIPNNKLFDIILMDLLNNTAQMDPSISILIKRKALELLNEKLTKLEFNEMEQNMSIKIIENLFPSLKFYQENIKEIDDNEIHNIQLILLSLKILTKFMDNNSDKIESETTIQLLCNVVTTIIQMSKFINVNESKTQIKLIQNLKTSSILCLSQILTTLSLEGISFLSDIINLILENFDFKDDIVVISNVSALYKVIVNFAKFLSPHLKSIILRMLSVYSFCDNTDLRQKINKIWITIAKSVPKRIVFETIDLLYDTVILNSPESIVVLMNLFKLSCDYVEKSDVAIIWKNLKNLMLKALNYRSLNHSKVNLTLIEKIETSFCEAFSAFIPKLTESTFRPIYYSLIQWSIQVDQYKIFDQNNQYYTLPEEFYHRMISFYRLCSFLADRLKSLFCVFVAPTIIQNCNQILVAYHSPENDKELEENKTKSKSQEEYNLKLDDSNIGEPLVSAILSTISKCFLYDLNGTFVNKECMSLIIKPIVNQISNLFGNEEDYQTRLDLILQCTQYLIHNNKDETLIKDFNYQILLKTRESNEKVKIGAIKVLHRLILICNEDYLPFIPEAMPFISELSEDESGSVESQLVALITDIEQLIGEPISKYL